VSLVGVVVIGLIGLILAYSLLRSGSLWFALGFHAAWNFTQSFLFGLATSGGAAGVSLLSARVEGDPLLTGGATGPEGSLLMLPVLVVLGVLVHRLGGQRPSATAAQ